MDFKQLLNELSKIKGKFLLSSYPSDLLTVYTLAQGWETTSFYQRVSVNAKGPFKGKTEVLTANYVTVG